MIGIFKGNQNVDIGSKWHESIARNNDVTSPQVEKGRTRELHYAAQQL